MSDFKVSISYILSITVTRYLNEGIEMREILELIENDNFVTHVEDTKVFDIIDVQLGRFYSNDECASIFVDNLKENLEKLLLKKK